MPDNKSKKLVQNIMNRIRSIADESDRLFVFYASEVGKAVRWFEDEAEVAIGSAVMTVEATGDIAGKMIE